MWNYLLNNSFKLFVNLNCRKLVCFSFNKKAPQSTLWWADWRDAAFPGPHLPPRSSVEVWVLFQWGDFLERSWISFFGTKSKFLTMLFLNILPTQGEKCSFNLSREWPKKPPAWKVVYFSSHFICSDRCVTSLSPLCAFPKPFSLCSHRHPILVPLVSLLDPLPLPWLIVWGGFSGPWGPDTGWSWILVWWSWRKHLNKKFFLLVN